MVYNKGMTSKQAKAIEILSKGNGMIPVSKAMKEAGYSPSAVDHPKVLTTSKAFKSVYAPLLKKNNVTIKKYIKNVGEAMDASKTVIIGKGEDAFADVVPDYTTRLQGNKQAERFLFDDKPNPGSTPVVIDNTAILEAIKAGDMVTLQQAIFNQPLK